jgi:nucleoid DNA-binding protein
LNPKKAKDFKKPTAEELGLSEDLVSKFVDFYWEKVRKTLTELEYPSIEILNLGTFKIKHWKINETVENYKNMIERMSGKFSVYKRQMEFLSRINKLESLKKQVEEKEVKFKEKKDARKNKDNLEKQEPDTSGLPEQDL